MRLLAIAALLSSFLLPGCVGVPTFRDPGLQRALFPGLEDLPPEEIEAALGKEVSARPPLSAGLVWIGEAPSDPWTSPLSEYHRTGVLEAAGAALRQDPFRLVTSIPTVLAPASGSAQGKGVPSPATLDALRGACARFQCDVALLMQTGVAREQGLNLLAIGYCPLVTMPLIPGNDIAVSTSVEICAIDVRSGVPLGCARGRSAKTRRCVFFWSQEASAGRLAEEALREAVADAAEDLRAQLGQRFVAMAARSGEPRPAK